MLPLLKNILSARININTFFFISSLSAVCSDTSASCTTFTDKKRDTWILTTMFQYSHRHGANRQQLMCLWQLTKLWVEFGTLLFVCACQSPIWNIIFRGTLDKNIYTVLCEPQFLTTLWIFCKTKKKYASVHGIALISRPLQNYHKKKKNPTTSSNWRIDAEMYVNSSQYLRFLQGRIFIKSFTIQKHHWPATAPHVKKYLILSNLIMLCVIHTYVNWLTSVAFPLNWRLQNRRYQKLPELRNYHVLVVITSAWLQHIPRSSTSHAIHTCFQSAF